MTVPTGNHPSLAGISRPSSLSDSDTGPRTPPGAQFSSTTHNLLFIVHNLLFTTSTPLHTISLPDFNSTASSSTSISSSYMSTDQPTASKGSQPLRTLVINLRSLHTKKAVSFCFLSSQLTTEVYTRAAKKAELWNLVRTIEPPHSCKSRHHHWIRNIAEARYSQCRDIPTHIQRLSQGQNRQIWILSPRKPI